MKRKTEKDYHVLAESRGFNWVGGVFPRDIKDPTWWECEELHRWEANYNSIQQGSGCPVCFGNNRKTRLDYHNLAENRGFRWVGEVLPGSTHDLTLWECENGDRWEAEYHRIQQGSGCPVCSGKVRKTEKDYHELAESRGFKWVGPVLPKSTHDPTWWECAEGDRWLTRYNSIQRGDGCPVCFGNSRKTEEDYHKLAKSRGFKWIGDMLPKTVLDITWWECEEGHRWETRYHYIQQGSGCPICKGMINGAYISKPQCELNGLLCGSLNYPEGRYRIDVAIMRKSQKIAVEYDCQYWHSGREEYDVRRDSFLVSKGWKILHVKANYLIPARKQLTTAIGHLLNTDDKVFNLYLADWK